MGWFPTAFNWKFHANSHCLNVSPSAQFCFQITQNGWGYNDSLWFFRGNNGNNEHFDEIYFNTTLCAVNRCTQMMWGDLLGWWENFRGTLLGAKLSKLGAICTFWCSEYSHLCSRDDASKPEDAGGGNNRFLPLFYAFAIFWLSFKSCKNHACTFSTCKLQ